MELSRQSGNGVAPFLEGQRYGTVLDMLNDIRHGVASFLLVVRYGTIPFSEN